MILQEPRVAVNNIFQNGTYAWPATPENNLINVDPLFVAAPTTVNGSIDITTTDFSLTSDSPAINAGNSNHTPLTDIIREPTTICYPMQYHHQVLKILLTNGQVLVQLLAPSYDDFFSGNSSLLISDRTSNWHSPKLVLTNLLTVGESYTFYVWVKLSDWCFWYITVDDKKILIKTLILI